MSGKKWILMFLATLALVLALYAGFNIVVDPFGVFGDRFLNWYSYDETNNPRVAKIAYLEKHAEEYDSYIIGSSSAASIDPKELDQYLDARFYNLFVYGCDTKDYRDMANYLFDHCEVKNLVLDIGINEATMYDTGEDKMTSKMHARASGKPLFQFYLEYAFADTRYAVEKLQSRKKDTELPQKFDVFDVGTGTYDKRLRDIEKIGDPDVYEAAHGGDFEVPSGGRKLSRIKECAETVAYIRDLCERHGARLIVIASPVYIGQWEMYTEETLREYKSAIAAETDYYDFSLTPISYDSRYFYDATHFRNAVGSMMLAEIFGNDDVWRPESFGNLVTKKNCGEYLDGLFSKTAETPRENYTTEVPVLLYHHFTDEPSSDMEVTPATFESHMAALAEAGFNAVTTKDMYDYVYRGLELPENPVLITIDDGYRSNYEIAWPILEKTGMKATIFAIGATVGNTEHYKDTDFPITPHFSFDEAREMIASGAVDIQSHTYDMHQWPAYETGDRIRSSVLPFEGESEKDFAAAVTEDTVRYAEISEREFGSPFIALAYPGGKYNDLAEVTVHEAGIPVTFSTKTNSRNILVKGLPQTLYALCRVIVPDYFTPEELIERMSNK